MKLIMLLGMLHHDFITEYLSMFFLNVGKMCIRYSFLSEALMFAVKDK